MDYKQEQFMRMQQYQYAPKMPFYMSYPVQNVFAAEMEYERDMERMKELYPEDAKRILKLVEEECDKLEYEGSMMFDEYPDRVMLKVICDRIYQKAKEAQEEPEKELEAKELEAGQVEALDYRGNPGRPPGPPPGWGPPPPPPGPPPGWGPPPPPPGPPGWGPQPPGWRPPPPPPNRPGLGNLIEVLLYNEMYQRRCRHNRCRRMW